TSRGPHCDQSFIGPLIEGGETCIAIAGEEEGFLLLDSAGNILRRDRVGHCQDLRAGRLRRELPGLQIVATNQYAGGTTYLYDCHGRPLDRFSMHERSGIALLVNWRGDGVLDLCYAQHRDGVVLSDSYGELFAAVERPPGAYVKVHPF